VHSDVSQDQRPPGFIAVHWASSSISLSLSSLPCKVRMALRESTPQGRAKNDMSRESI